jgi:hypothetical protein
MNRFSKEIDALETSIGYNFDDCFSSLLNIISVIFIISVTTPLFLLTLFPLVLFYFFIQVSLLYCTFL